MYERTWQFRLYDVDIKDYASYFEKRAREVAEAMNCRVVASNVLEIENLQPNIRKIVGRALLENTGLNMGTIVKARRGGRRPQPRNAGGQ